MTSRLGKGKLLSFFYSVAPAGYILDYSFDNSPLRKSMETVGNKTGINRRTHPHPTSETVCHSLVHLMTVLGTSTYNHTFLISLSSLAFPCIFAFVLHHLITFLLLIFLSRKEQHGPLSIIHPSTPFSMKVQKS